MKWLRWDTGRQESGYSKLLVVTSKWLKFDCYILKFPEGTGIPDHIDPAIEGYEHHRLNLILNKPCIGTGEIKVDGPARWIGDRLMIFRPDMYWHSMTPVSFIWEKNCYILSVGWLKKEKR